MEDKISIVIADDHPIVREGLIQTIENDARLVVVGEANDGQEAIDLIEKHRPNIAVLDIDMPIQNGFDVARWIAKSKIAIEIIFLTMHSEEDIFNEAINLGAKGFVLKESAVLEIVESIKTVASSKHYASAALTSFLINRTKRAIQGEEAGKSVKHLTPTERRVLKLVAENLTTNEIAEHLHVSKRTIDKHRSNIAAKLDLKGSHALLKFALAQRSNLL